jgi:beta-N-acetylhexosaminidase
MDFKPELSGQIFILGYDGLSPSEEFFKLIKDWNLGGVIIFSENIESQKQIKDVISRIKSNSEIPPFVMIDQEGGQKNRITDDFPIFHSNKYYGKRDDEKGLYDAYRITAQSLRELGINVNLAPVVDVLTNPKNKVIAERSFGDNAQKVSEFYKLALEAMHKGGILSCAKHFPGIGDIQIDPHQEMPENKNPKERFEKIDFPPFKAAISSGTDFIMTTHVKCPFLDPESPASLSRIICTDILKIELGYEGLVITDDLGMGAIKRNFDVIEACERAYFAGNDLILLCHEYEKQSQILKRFSKLLIDKKIEETRFSGTLDKIISKKKKTLI